MKVKLIIAILLILLAGSVWLSYSKSLDNDRLNAIVKVLNQKISTYDRLIKDQNAAIEELHKNTIERREELELAKKKIQSIDQRVRTKIEYIRSNPAPVGDCEGASEWAIEQALRIKSETSPNINDGIASDGMLDVK